MINAARRAFYFTWYPCEVMRYPCEVMRYPCEVIGYPCEVMRYPCEVMNQVHLQTEVHVYKQKSM
jgi:hypothetical protein